MLLVVLPSVNKLINNINLQTSITSISRYGPRRVKQIVGNCYQIQGEYHTLKQTSISERVLSKTTNKYTVSRRHEPQTVTLVQERRPSQTNRATASAVNLGGGKFLINKGDKTG